MIARGALLKALHNPAGQRILTQSYGFKRDEEYNPGLLLHRSGRSLIDYHEGYEIAPSRISWLCKAVSFVNLFEVAKSYALE